MSKFVTSCMEVMNVVTLQLLKKLVEDTKDMALRAGLHSGKVTGGVLRGDKGLCTTVPVMFFACASLAYTDHNLPYLTFSKFQKVDSR